MILDNPNLDKTIPIEQTMPIGANQLTELTKILQEYKAGKANLERRVIAAENWWKLRNSTEEQSASELMTNGFTSRSAWLHNVIVTKHADAMEAYPEPNVLPREMGDKGEARMLSDIIPCILEQNDFEKTYSDVMWRKTKGGTGVYKVVWNKNKHNGLGDIEVSCVNLLNLFWEAGITDIQKSRYVFQTELYDKDLLKEMYPEQLKDGVKGDAFTAAKFLYDDHVKTDNKATVIECYYHKYVEGKNTLQYIKYVGDKVLYATENDMEPVADPFTGEQKPPMAVTGLYDHGLYPYVFDALYPIEGSPCGYGYIDIGQSPQTLIDVLETCFARNARAGAMPRYFGRNGSSINEEEFLDLSKTIVHVEGNLNEDYIRKIDVGSIDGSYMNLMQWAVDELRETSGNNETATGGVPSGVTSGAAIAAIQAASGKGSKDATKGSYRAFGKVVELCIELIRQFYTMPRKFRVLGQFGAEQYITYTNEKLQAQQQQGFGDDMGMRLPVFDVKISAQTKNVYTKVTQNELALQFFNLGFCNPQMTDQSLMCLDMMDFDGKDAIMQKISQNGTMFDKLQQYMQMSLTLAQVAAPQYVQQIAMDMQATTGQAPQMPQGGAVELTQTDSMTGMSKEEAPTVEKARAQAEAASQPNL
jgi:hypothetical protein